MIGWKITKTRWVPGCLIIIIIFWFIVECTITKANLIIMRSLIYGCIVDYFKANRKDIFWTTDRLNNGGKEVHSKNEMTDLWLL